MSKELAQTVRSKKVAALVAILALFTVFATLGNQWRSADAAVPTAAATLTNSTASTVPGAPVVYTFAATFTPSGSVAAAANANTLVIQFDADLVYVGDGGDLVGIAAANCGAPVAGLVTCASVAASWTTGSLTFSFTNPLTGTISAPVINTCLNDGTTGAGVCTNAITGYSVDAATATGATATAGSDATVSFTIPQGTTYCQDVVAGTARTFANADIVVTGGTLVSATPGLAASTGTDTVTAVLRDDATLGMSAVVRYHLDSSTVTTDCIDSPTATVTVVQAELRHIADDGTVIAVQDVYVNVRGSRHTVCTVQADTTTAITIPLTALNQISVSSGGGFTAISDPDPTFTDPQIFTGSGGANGLNGATCFSWVSTEAGDQEISVTYTGTNGLPYTVDWDSDADGNGTTVLANRSLIKEWNVLVDSCVSATGGATGTGCGSSTSTPVLTLNVPGIFNPATSRYDFVDIVLSDVFRGSHVTRTGSAPIGAAAGPWPLAGVNYTAATLATGSCGAISGAAAGTTTLLQSGAAGGNPVVTFTPDSGPVCGIGSWAEITFTGSEPAPIGSGSGVTVTQKVRINIVTPPLPTKQVFLAWAGQRVILEHDWRLPPGDHDGGTSPNVVNDGTCPFLVFAQAPNFRVTYTKSAGPGSFVAGLGADVTNLPAQATVDVSTDPTQDDTEVMLSPTSGPQASCISRVLFESEDQGQVDVEAYVTHVESDGWVPLMDNQTKIAFVVYYMKLEGVTVSLVDDVSKPSHNSSTYAYADWNPGNPWDASKDVSTVDWNVSKDLLVRARVKGWFTTSNATGRAAGTDTNGGALPAGRWVMPDDWPLLAGGPADPADGSDATGIAEAYRPEFDIMIAPNNKLGRSLLNPEGTTGDVAVTTVAVAMGGTAATTTVTVASAANIPVGACIVIDSEVMSVTAKVGSVLTVTRFASPVINCSGTTTTLAAHAVGALVIIINLTGVPFEGPYSLLDIPGLAASGFGGAALSNWDANNIRDTIWGDGDVDMWDAPMPPSLLTVSIRGSGFIKQVLKESAYYIGTANASGQVFPNPFYIVNIPDSPFIPPVVAGGGYFWDSWGLDGPGCVGGPGCNTTPTVDGDGVYRFWWPVIIGSNMWGVGDTSVTSTQAAELAAIRTAYGDSTIARDLVVYTDNHGEAMVAANGDFKLDYSGCAANALAGGKHCAPGDKAGASTITAVADYPDFRGKHYPLLSNVATVNWTWGGYKDVTIEDGETEQYKYVVFHAMDRDGFCYAAPVGSVQLHPVLTSHSNNTFNNNPSELVDFMIDSGEGIIIGTSNGASSSSQYTKQFAEGVPTFSTYANDPAVSLVKEFPLSSLAATGAVDECQAWVKVSNSLLGILDILVIAHDDEGNIGFDKIIDLQSTMSYSLSFRWTLFTWAGADGLATADALKGSGGSTNDITSSVTAVYGWDPAAQAWLGYFPSAVPVPGANDLTKLTNGDAYWIAITGPGSVTWTIATNVD